MNTVVVILRWLDARLPSAEAGWLRDRCQDLSAGAPERAFHLAYGQVVRRAGRAPLRLSETELSEARTVHPGWDPGDWTCEQAARAALLLSLPPSPRSATAVLDLFQTADLGEHVALVRALFLSPQARDFLHVAREAIRSNMGDVFRAITHRNPYPAEQFDEIAWNQMIVKCLFVDLPLRTVHGLDERVNPELARMIIGLANERWAAGRMISPEAWRCVAPFAAVGTESRTALEDAFRRDPADRRGAAIALWSVPDGSGRDVVRALAPELVPLLEAGTLTWENHGQS